MTKLGIADLFEVPVEALVGRAPHGSDEDQLTFTVRALLDAVHQSVHQASGIRQKLELSLSDIFTDDGCDEILKDGEDAARYLKLAQQHLEYITESAEQFLEGKRGKQQKPNEA